MVFTQNYLRNGFQRRRTKQERRLGTRGFGGYYSTSHEWFREFLYKRVEFFMFLISPKWFSAQN